MAKLSIVTDIDEAYDIYSENDHFMGYFDFFTKNNSYWSRDRLKYCGEICEEYDGKNLKIVSYDDFYFTAGFIYETDLGATNFYYFTVWDEDEIEIESASIIPPDPTEQEVT